MKTLQNISNKWTCYHVNYIKTSGTRVQYRIFNFKVYICNQIRSYSSNTRVIVFMFTRPESYNFHGKSYIRPLYWNRHLKLKSEFTTVVSDLKNPWVIVSGTIIARKFKIDWISSIWPPYWIRYFQFLKSDFGIVITDLRNDRVRVFKSITAKKSRIHWNIVCEIAILNPPFRMFRFWFQIRNLRPQKPWKWPRFLYHPFWKN